MIFTDNINVTLTLVLLGILAQGLSVAEEHTSIFVYTAVNGYCLIIVHETGTA